MASYKLRRGIALGATPGRLCLVALLGLVLLIVLYRQISPAGPAAATLPAAKVTPVNTAGTLSELSPPASRRKAVPRPPDPTPPARSKEHDSWNERALDLISLHDPFAVPPAFLPPPPPPEKPKPVDPLTAEGGDSERQRQEQQRQAAATSKAREAALDALTKQGVRVILRDGDQWIAVVGDQTIRVGDLLGSFRVTEISPDGVVVEDTVP